MKSCYFHYIFHLAADFIPDSPTEQLWADFKATVLRIVEKQVRFKTKAAQNSNPWIDTSIRKSIRRKQRAHKKARKKGKKRDTDHYKHLPAEVKFDTQRVNRSYLEEIISEDFNTDQNKFWSYISGASARNQQVSLH